MKVNEVSFTRWFQYITEMILVYIITTPFNMFHNALPSIEAFLLICGFGVIPYVLIIRRSESINLGVIYVITLVIGVFVYALGGGQILYVIYTAIVGWRVAAHYKEPDQYNEKTIFYLTLSLGIAVFCLLALLGFDDKNIILGLVVFQMIFILSGRMLKDILMNSKDHQLTLRDVRLPVMISSFLLLIAVLGATMFNIVKQGTIFLVTIITKGITFLFYPLFMFFEGLEIKPQKNNGREEGQTTFLDQLRDNQQEQLAESNIVEILMLVFVGIILISLLIYFIRKKISVSPHSEDEKQRIFTRESIKENGFKDQIFSNFSRNKPVHKIRKLFFDFERFALKKSLGRKSDESILEWFNRLGLQDKAEEMANLYRKVRYGHIELTEEETRIYESKIKGLKAEINHILKVRKQEQP